MKYLSRWTAILILMIANVGLSAKEKKAISHDDYADWKTIGEYKLSNDGSQLCYVIKPQEGDGFLYNYNIKTNSVDSIARAYSAKYSPKSNFIVFKIKPQFDTLRAAKLKKVKKNKLPKDSVGVWNLKTGKIFKYPGVKSFRVAKQASDFVALLLEKEKNEEKGKADSTAKEKIKNKGNTLRIFNPVSNFSTDFEDVSKYAVSDNGSIITFLTLSADSIDSVFVHTYNTKTLVHDIVFSSRGFSKNIAVDKNGEQIAFTFSADTAKTKNYSLIYNDLAIAEPINITTDDYKNLNDGLCVSTDGRIYFNDAGDELYFGVREKQQEEAKDSLTKDEKVSLDIWNWKDPLLQPQQLKELKSEKKRSFVAVYFPKYGKVVALADDSLRNVRINKKATGNLSLAYDRQNYFKETSWDGNNYADYYLVDRADGSRTKILKKVASIVSFSPKQDYVAWYNITDSSWNIYDVEGGESKNVSSELKVNFYNELNDIPREAYPYGMAGWTKEGHLVVYDDFDLWEFDPSGKQKPKNITKKYGRKSGIEFRYRKLDPEERFLPDSLFLFAFSDETKKSGCFLLEPDKKPKELIWEDKSFLSPKKAKNADVLVWRKQTFEEYPELFISDSRFNGIKKITTTNPQQSNFNWGTVELVSWKTYDNEKMQGLLYKPEDFDPDKKYPMLVYFYERKSDELHRHYVPAPIRSVINFTYYTSNGYVIFVPDIKYKTGYPGPGAYNCIVSGTEAMLEQFDFIDKQNIGIQGQSWGGYQTAYIITQTDLYKAAMAGAPVSNMTSAYGGIRWGSGRSRAFQYEETQSRIGGTLWDKQDLYILNSPLFFIPKINTPLLMMHNDKDGAVPWYQGIEMFNAMRRLNKPVWMLVYNGAPHNLKRRADMKDLTVRMQQFFDHFLKDAPEPKWMKTGIPAIDKGKDFGFETDMD